MSSLSRNTGNNRSNRRTTVFSTNLNYKARFNILTSLKSKHRRNMQKNPTSRWYNYIIQVILPGVFQFYEEARRRGLTLSQADVELPIFLSRVYPNIFIHGRVNGNNRNYRTYAGNLVNNIIVRVRNRSIPNISSNSTGVSRTFFNESGNGSRSLTTTGSFARRRLFQP